MLASKTHFLLLLALPSIVIAVKLVLSCKRYPSDPKSRKNWVRYRNRKDCPSGYISQDAWEALKLGVPPGTDISIATASDIAAAVQSGIMALANDEVVCAVL